MKDLASNAVVLQWVWRLMMVALTAGLYWLQSNFIPRTEFVQQKEEAIRQYHEDKKTFMANLERINTLLNNLDVSMRLFETNRRIIEDHEQRIRALERGERLRALDK